MSIHQVTNLLVTITLVEMMATIGLGVTMADLRAVARNGRLIVYAALANYVCVPAATVGLLLAFQAQPLTAAGFLILAVCPGAPYGPPLTAIAKGNVPAAVGLMALLAVSSAVVAPLLLSALLPLMAGDERLGVDAAAMVVTLLVTQLLPLSAGLLVRHVLPALAERMQRPATLISKLLNVAVVGLILATQFHTLSEIRARGFVGMFALLLASLAAGWLLGGPAGDGRKALTLTTSLRNVGLSLVIATRAFAGTPAVTAVLAYGILEVLGSLLLAVAWGRRSATRRGIREVTCSDQLAAADQPARITGPPS
jgi:bile acid:Na+ symporter, BASS family